MRDDHVAPVAAEEEGADDEKKKVIEVVMCKETGQWVVREVSVAAAKAAAEKAAGC